MRKFVDPLPAKGAPLFNTEVNGVLQREVWESLEKLMASLIHPIGAMIITNGVQTDDGSGGFNITKGIAYVNGEFMEFDASSNNPFPSYLGASTTVIEQIEFADSIDRDYVEVKRAEMFTSPPAGNFVVINGIGNSGVNFNTYLARQFDLQTVITDRANEAKSRPVLVANVDVAGVMTVIYATGGTWTASLFTTGIYDIKQNAGIPVETAVIITPTEVGTSNGVAMSYRPVLGQVKSYDINSGNAVNKGFSIVIYPQ